MKSKEKSSEEFVAFVSSNGMLNIPAKLKREMGITAKTPLRIEREDDDSIRVTKMRLIRDSVAAEMWKKYPPVRDPRAVSKIRKIRRELYLAGEQWD